MFVYKKLKASDAGITAFEAHKEFNINKDNTASLGISLIDSSYSSASKDTYSQFNTNNELQYFQLDHLFYKDSIFNIGNLNGGINYLDQEKRLYDKATIVSISQKNFGSAIQKGTLTFNDTYIDDSKGNLYNQNETLSNYPTDKERVFYLGPVKGFKRTDLTRDLKTGELVVNYPSTYNDKKLDDSLYTNPVQYISCSIEHISDLNCTSLQLENGYVKVPHNNNFNFGDEDFTITFFYKTSTTTRKYILAKSKTQTTVQTPASNLDGSLKNTQGSASLLQATEVDAGRAYPFEIEFNRNITFRRSDQDTVSEHSSGALTNNTLYHVACVKTESQLRIYINGALSNGTSIDNTDLCKNKADLFIGTNPDISQNKLDNTAEQQVSQLMVWNRALSSTEIGNVSESIHGSPYVGNVFYENGIVTFTSPTINDGAFSSTTAYSPTIFLNPTQWLDDEGDFVDVRVNTFSGSFTFFNQETTLSVNSSSFASEWDYNSTLLELDYDRGAPNPDYFYVDLISKPDTILDSYQINPIREISYDTYDNYTELNSIINAIPGLEGTGSGDLGTDGDSYTIIQTPTLGNDLILKLNADQTVTASFDIDPITPTEEIDDVVVGYIPNPDDGPGFIYTPLTDALLEDESVFEFGSSNDGGTIQGAMVTSTTGEIAITGSNGFVSFFTRGNDVIPQPKIETNHSTPASTTTFPAYVTFGDGGTQTFGVTVTGTNLVSSTYPHNFTNTDAVSVGNRKFVFGPAAEDYADLTYKKLYKAPGTITFKIQAYAYRSADTTVTAYTEYRYKPSGGSFGSWTSWGSSTPIGTLSTPISKQLNRTSNYINFGDQYEFRIRFEKGPGFGQVSLAPSARVWISDQSVDPGFKDRLMLQTDYNELYLEAGDEIKYTFDTIRGFNTYNPSGYVQGDIEILRDHSQGGDTNNTLSYDGVDQDANLSDISLWIKLFKYNQGPATLMASHELTSNQTLSEYFTVPQGNTGNYFFQMYLGDSNGNILFTNAFQGFSFRRLLVERWDTTSTYSISNYVGPGGATYQEFGTNSNDNDVSWNQSITFDDNTVIQNGSVPPAIYNWTNPSEITFNTQILITSSLGATASFDQGNYISGSASIDITGTKGIYRLDNLTIDATNTAPTTGTPHLELYPTQKVRAQVKKNGTVIDTKYQPYGAGSTNLYQAIADKLQLGILDNTDNISIEFAVVDSSNDLDKVVKNQGFIVKDIQLRKLTGSNEITRVDGQPFDTTLSEIRFSSSHANIGDSELPFNIGQITASISSFNGDGTIAYIDTDYLITSSLNDSLYEADGIFSGPFIISASYDFDYKAGKEYKFDFGLTTLITEPTSDSDANTGTGFRILDANNNIVAEYGPTPYPGFVSLSDLEHQRFTSDGTGKLLLFVSGVSSPNYPNGIVTSSALNYTASLTTFVLDLIALSGSYTSSGDTVSIGDFSNSDKLHITSAHDSYTGNDPSLNTGKFTTTIVERTSEGNIRVTTPLFITASSEMTGSEIDQVFVPENPTAIEVNPFTTLSQTNPNMIGGTFVYTDPETSTTETLTITALTDNGDGTTDVTVNNGVGTFQVGEYDNQQGQEVTVNYTITTTDDITMQFKNTHLIFENEFHCTVEPDEFNFTLNPTARKYKTIERSELANFATGSNFRPYVTTIGLYNEEGELLVVGKLAQPVRASEETDTTFVVRFDT